MYASIFSVFLFGLLAIMLALRLWVALRQVRHVLAHRYAVPPEFATTISLASHQKAAEYAVAKAHFGIAAMISSAVVLIGFTLLGGLQALAELLAFQQGMFFQLLLILSFAFLSSLVGLPFRYYRQFVMEECFSFNKMTPRLWIGDVLKNWLLFIIIGLPLAGVVLLLMDKSGPLWWLYAWLFITGFQLLMIVIVPTLIAPLFNKFTPLVDDGLRSRVEALLTRTDCPPMGMFLMDGSRRSAHGNAYFYGFGASKRIVFFDTMMTRLEAPELEAMLAHELGHFKFNHIVKRMMVMFAVTFCLLALLSFLKHQAWFYTGMGVDSQLGMANNGITLILFALTLPVLTNALAPLASLSSRKAEFEADAFAAAHTDAADLISALVKMYDDSASTLTPDPLHSALYDSHPPAALRISHLNTLAR